MVDRAAQGRGPSAFSRREGPPRIVVLHSQGEKDLAHLTRFCKHLDPLAREGRIDLFAPTDLAPGDVTTSRVREAIERADAVVLLVSADLLACEHFVDHERLLKRLCAASRTDSSSTNFDGEAAVGEGGRAVPRVVPLRSRAYALERTILHGLQALPRVGPPIEERGKDAEQAWADVTEELCELLSVTNPRDLAAESRRFRDYDLDVRDPRARERVNQVVRVAKLHAPDAEVKDLPAVQPFAGLVLVTTRTERAEKVEPIGVLDGPVGEKELKVFQNEIEKPYRDEWPLLATRIVHTGDPVSNDLYRRALREGVEIESFASYQKRLANFDRYLAWQTGLINRDPAYPESLYVDQRGELKIRLDREATTDVLAKLVELMEDPYPRVVLVLGDFGTGKTFLLRQLARKLARRYREPGALVPPPVLVEMRALDKSGGLDGLLAQHFVRADGAPIPVPNFRHLLSEGHGALLFDGFDELAFRVTYESVMAHLDTVLSAAEGNAKVVVTSRTAHFLNDQDVELALAKKVSQRTGYRLIKLHPFDQTQIHAALVRRLGNNEAADQRMALLREVEDLMGLSANPRMLGFILEIPTTDLEEAKKQKGRITSATLYELLVTKWLEGEAARSLPTGSERPVLNLAELWQVVTDLSVVAWTHVEKRIRKDEIPADLWAKLERMDQNRKVDVGTAEHAMGSRSLLVRDDEERFSFWHESILDWLVARASAAELSQKGDAPALGKKVMSDLMSDFFTAMAGKDKAVAWARAALTGGSDAAVQNANRVLRKLGVNAEEEDIVIDVTPDLSGHDLRGQDLSGSTHLRGAILEGANLSGATLVGADLSRADLSRAKLSWVNAERVLLEGANLERADLSHAHLLRADLRGARLSDARLRYARLVGANVEPEISRALGEMRTTPSGIDLWGLVPSRPARSEPVTLGPMLQGGLAGGQLLAFSPDGALLAVGDAAGTIQIWDVNSRRALYNWAGSAARITSLAFSEDGSTLASASDDTTVRLWDARSHAHIATLRGHSTAVLSVAFSPNGHMLASASEDSTICLWNAKEYFHVAELHGHSQSVWSVAFSPDGVTLASASRDNTIRLWDTRDRSFIACLQGHSSSVLSVAFSPDGRTLASASSDTTVCLWDVHARSSVAILSGHSNYVRSVAFSPDGRLLASASRDTTVRLWDAHSYSTIASLQGHFDSVLNVTFSRDGRTLASVSDDDSVRLWDALSYSLSASLQGYYGSVSHVVFSPDGRTLASVDDDKSVRLWDAHAHRFIALTHRYSDSVLSIALSSDGRTYATAAHDSTVCLWDADSHSLIALLEHRDLAVNSVAFSPDGRILASSSGSTVSLWEVQSYNLIASLKGHPGSVYSVAFSADGRTLAAAGRDYAIRLWDAHSHSVVASLRGHSGDVSSVAFSPDGRLLASASSDKTVRIWDAHTCSPIASLKGYESSVLSVVFSPDGRLLASASSDKTVRIWDAHTYSPIASLQGHSNLVRSVAFSPDGRTLASASDDGTIRLWDVATHQCLVVFVPAEQGWAAYSPDGRYKIHGDIDGRFWHVVGLCRFEPGELDDYLDAFTEHPPRRLRLDEPFY